jgi:predicted TIM-barrel fold metal-dependent hydrolase
MIIDCHVHLNNYHEDTVESIDARLEELERSMRRNRVDQAMILTSYKVSPGRPSTQRVAEAIRDRPHLRVVAGLNFHTFDPAELADLAPHVTQGLVRGLKLYPGYQPFYPADPHWAPAYAFAAEHRIPVMIHSGDTYSPQGKVKYSHPLHVDDAAVDFPDVQFLICHLGNPWIRDCMEVVYKNPNVWADVSGLVLGEFNDKFERFMLGQITEMITYAGDPRYLLYGTDWPICGMRSYLKFMRGLELTDTAREQIMWKNTAELFKIPVPEGAPDAA